MFTIIASFTENKVLAKPVLGIIPEAMCLRAS
jgi:hypothetical protein